MNGDWAFVITIRCGNSRRTEMGVYGNLHGYSRAQMIEDIFDQTREAMGWMRGDGVTVETIYLEPNYAGVSALPPDEVQDAVPDGYRV